MQNSTIRAVSLAFMDTHTVTDLNCSVCVFPEEDEQGSALLVSALILYASVLLTI